MVYFFAVVWLPGSNSCTKLGMFFSSLWISWQMCGTRSRLYRACATMSWEKNSLKKNNTTKNQTIETLSKIQKKSHFNLWTILCNNNSPSTVFLFTQDKMSGTKWLATLFPGLIHIYPLVGDIIIYDVTFTLYIIKSHYNYNVTFTLWHKITLFKKVTFLERHV